jgi:DNA invertase Pin-like site-specific DNA recombinase
MKIGYARVSKSNGEQSLDLQLDALKKDGVKAKDIYCDKQSGATRDRPQFESCLKALREDDTLVLYSLDRMGRSQLDLLKILNELQDHQVALKILSGLGAGIDTNTAMGKMMYQLVAMFSEHERMTIIERTNAGLAAARARGRVGGRKPALSKSGVRRAQAAMKSRDTSVSELALELGVSSKTLYEYVSPSGEIRTLGKKVLALKS